MRYLIVLLIVAAAGGMIWYALDAGHEPLEQEAAALGPEPGSQVQQAPKTADPVRFVAPGADSYTGSEEPRDKESSATRSTRRSLEGTLTDRFGAPVAKERVFLLARTQAHPPAGSDLTEYVTALTSAKGNFSLSLPGEGPWRIGVGSPGAPRIPPSEARTLTGTTRANVVVPGATALRIAFDEVPQSADPLTLEFMTLVEPGATVEGRGRPAGRRGGRANRGGGDRGTRPNRGTGDGGAGEGGKRRGGSDTRDARAPLEAAGEVWAQQAQDIGQGSSLGQSREPPTLGADRGGRGRRNQNQEKAQGEAKGAGDKEVQPLGPPAEVWRTLRRHKITDEERAAGVVQLSRLPAGPIARLALSVGDRRLEGMARFTLRADVITEVRVFAIEPGSGSLSYVAQAKPLPHGEAPTGVQWRD